MFAISQVLRLRVLLVAGLIAVTLLSFDSICLSARAQTNFGSVNIGSNATVTVTVPIAVGGTLSSIAVLTKGVANQDFNASTTGTTCTAGTDYSAGDSCAVAVTFSPKFPGTRSGAVVLGDTGGNVLATAYVHGIGLGPHIAFDSGMQITIPLSISNPAYIGGMGVDGNGSVYLADYYPSGAVEVPWTGSSYGAQFDLPATGLSGPYGVTVDGAGNVYIADTFNSRVVKLPWTGSSFSTQVVLPVSSLSSGFSEPVDVAVDGSGNLYIADNGYERIVEFPWNGSDYGAQTTLESGFMPVGVAVDGIGNVYSLNPSAGVIKLPWTGSAYGTPITIPVTQYGSGSHDLTVDGLGNLYVADGGEEIGMLPWTGSGYGPQIAIPGLPGGWSTVLGLGVDGDGNLYFVQKTTQYPGGGLAKVEMDALPQLSFNSTAYGSTSSDSPQTVTIRNSGNQPLTFSAVSFPADFPESSAGTGDCTASTSLAVGATCTLTIDFSPIASLGTGTSNALSENVTLTTNNLNAASTEQTVSVTGTETKATPSITWATPAAITYGTALSATQLNATSTVGGTFAYNPVAGTVLGVGSQTLSTTFTPTNTTDYTTATATVQLAVNKAASSVTTWPTATSITYGQTLVSSTLSGGVSTPAGSFAFTTPTTKPGTGTASQSVTFTPTDTTDYSTLAGTTSVTVNKATPSVTNWPTASSITYGQTLASSTLSGGASTPAGSFAFTTPTTAPGAGTASQSVTFTPTDTTDYSTLAGTTSVTVNKATPSVTTWPTASSITYGQTLASSTLTGGASTPAGSFAFTTPTTKPGTGTASQSVTFTPTDATDYSTLTGTASVTVNKATPSITWATPAAITYGTALSGTQLNATASVPGAFVYSPAAGTTPAVGNDTLSVTFTPTDATDYTTATASVTLVVNSPSNPVPLIGSMSPGFASAGGTSFTLTVNGTGFVSGSTVYWGTSALATTFGSATQLTAQVPATDIATAGTTAAITVVNPTPGGGTSNSFQFEVNSASGSTTGPTFSSVTQTVTAGSPASYPVTLPSTVESATITCLNLPTGATCSYSATTNTVTITTSSTTPKGTYQITVVFTETVSGAASGLILLPFLLLPLAFLRKQLATRGVWVTACLGLVLLAGAAFSVIGCGGGSSSTPPPQTHQVVSSGTVSLTIQ